MSVNSSCSVDFSQFPLHLGESPAHLGRLSIRQRIQSSLVDGSSGRQPKVGCSLGDIDGEHFELVGILHGRCSSIVDAHGPFRKTVLLFQLGIHEEQGFAELLRAILEGLFEQVSCSLQLFPAVTFDEFGKVDVPDLKGDREMKQLDTSFIDLTMSLLTVLGKYELTLNDSSKYLFSSKNAA